MCGICGELSFDLPVDLGVLRRMTDTLVHRGPDDEGLYCEGRIGLGHRRLSILDLSVAGRQPFWTADQSMAIVFNGEVYNYREIRPDLEARGYRFTSTSDTEVVLNAIHCWGLEPALQKFIGMFAFALWNARERSLFLVRDRVGVKPLYYHRSARTFLFGSELKALYAHPRFTRELDPGGLGQYFVLGYGLGADTVFKNTFKVPAGHYLKVTDFGAVHIHRYWNLDNFERGSFRGSFNAAVEQLESLSDSAFGYRLVSDVPVGVFLSGGIDSTFLAAFLKRRLDVDLQHITIGFQDPKYDEAPKAAQVAAQLGLNHSVKYIDSSEAQQALVRFTEIWDEPFGDTSGIPSSILCGVARKQVKVVLSADGGDEQFCGYESYPSYASRFCRIQHAPAALRHLAAMVLGRVVPYRPIVSAFLSRRPGTRWNPQTLARYEKALDLLRANDAADLIRVMNEKGWTAGTVENILQQRPADAFAGTVLGATHLRSMGGELMDRMMRTDFSAFLGDDVLTKVDRASMAVSLECREPFLDHRLVEFAFSLPMEFLYARGQHKRILKHILRRWIGEPILAAPKRGFVIPLYDWLRGPWKPLVDEYLTADRIRSVGVLDEKSVAAEVRQFYRYEGGRAERIMLMLNFQMWAERWYCR